MQLALKLLSEANVIFWDFDGVIKDPVDAKTAAYGQLFEDFQPGLAERVREHHRKFSGVSRFEKIPLYLDWAGIPVTEKTVDEFCVRFSELVLNAVVEAPWVVGVRQWILENYQHHAFILVTATPQKEIEDILKQIDLAYCFDQIHGSPKKKEEAVESSLQLLGVNPNETLFVGDAETDFRAAQKCSVPFLWRETSLNKNLRSRLTAPGFVDLQYSNNDSGHV